METVAFGRWLRADIQWMEVRKGYEEVSPAAIGNSRCPGGMQVLPLLPIANPSIANWHRGRLSLSCRQ